MTGTQSSRVDGLDLRSECFAEDRFIVIVERRIAKPGGDFHRRGKDAEKLLETRSTEFGFDRLGAEHAGVDGTISLGIELADVEEVRVAEKCTSGDDDPGFSPLGNFIGLGASERLFGGEALAREKAHPFDGCHGFDVRGVGSEEKRAVACGNPVRFPHLFDRFGVGFAETNGKISLGKNFLERCDRLSEVAIHRNYPPSCARVKA